jgi:hypothetical protein
MEKTSFEGEVQIDKVINSLNALKTSLYNVNYLNKIIQQNKEEIINAGEYASVIRPIIDKKNILGRISMFNVSLNFPDWINGKIYYSKNCPSVDNIIFKNICSSCGNVT